MSSSWEVALEKVSWSWIENTENSKYLLLKSTSSHGFRYCVCCSVASVKASCRRGSKCIYLDFSHDAISITFNLSVANLILCCHCLEGPCHLPQQNQKTTNTMNGLQKLYPLATQKDAPCIYSGERNGLSWLCFTWRPHLSAYCSVSVWCLLGFKPHQLLKAHCNASGHLACYSFPNTLDQKSCKTEVKLSSKTQEICQKPWF